MTSSSIYGLTTGLGGSGEVSRPAQDSCWLRFTACVAIGPSLDVCCGIAPGVDVEELSLMIGKTLGGISGRQLIGDYCGHPLAMNEENMTLVEAAVACPQCVVSVMGPHAGEDADTIFERKKADIEKLGKTFWLMKSPKARPDHVQEICKTNFGYTIFVEPATKGGARPTTKEDAAKEYSADGELWHRLPKHLSPVTGKLDTCTTALVFDMMDNCVSGTLDLWEYGEALDIQKPLRFMLGCSTVWAVRKDTRSHPEKMKSRYRTIVAIARLADPYCVWIR